MFGLSNTASSMAIRQFAEEIAQIYQKNVDLLVLNWGGELQQKKRIKVGEEVAIFLKDKYKNAEIWGIAHSHGCNIINNTAEKLRDYNLTIKRAILIAPIAVDINPYPLPYNIEEYFNFYSCGDLTQAAGSSQNGEPNSKFFISYPESKSYCLEVYAENEDIDHLTIKIAVLEQLTEILKTIKKDFSLATDLKLVLFKKNYQPLITISDDNKNCDYNKYINKFFYLEDFEKILEKQTETSLKNKEKLSEIFKQPLFKEKSSTQRFFHELSAAINQVPRHPWRNK